MKFKIAGAFLIFLSGLILSQKIKKRYDSRIYELNELIKDMNYLKNQVGFLKASLQTILEKIYINSKGSLKVFYKDILDGINKGLTIKNSFDKALEKNKSILSLSTRDKEILSEFASTLGVTDYENQLNNIIAAKELLTFQLNEAKCDKEKNQKSKSAMIICSSLVLCIILI